MSLLQENVYFFYRKVNKNAYFTLFEVNKNVNLVIFNMSKIAFCRFATLVVIIMLVILRENDLSLERPREFLSPIQSNDRQSRTIRSQVVGISCLSCCVKFLSSSWVGWRMEERWYKEQEPWFHDSCVICYTTGIYADLQRSDLQGNPI